MKSRLWPFPILAVVLTAGWQWTTVRANYGGNWTALYCTGALQRLPPLAAAERVYLFANSTGYDGQFHHYIAHDPFLRSDLRSYIDDARFRYRRILVPLLAYGLALGRSAWIDPAYELVILAGIGLGVYWSCRIAQEYKLAAGWGLLFLLLPAVPIAADRLVVDSGLAALTAAVLCYRRSWWKLYAVLACAMLVRETGLLLILACCAYYASKKKIQTAAAFLTGAIPALGWYLYVQAHTAKATLAATVIPFAAVLSAIGHPWTYPPGTPFPAAVRAADGLALAGLLLAFGIALLRCARGRRELPDIAAGLFALMGLCLGITGTLQSVYHFGRIYSPLLLCLGAVAAQERKPWLLAPAAMMLPRIAMQLTPQIVGIVR